METTVFAARNQLSALLRLAERGEEVIIRRGRGPSAKSFRLIAVDAAPPRTLTPDPRWAGQVVYRDADLFASEWQDEA